MKSKKKMESRKRFFADCPKCTLSFDADLYKDTVKKCICGEVLAWSDGKELKTLQGLK